MQGLTWQSLKKNPALIPLYVCVGVGVMGAAGYLIRLATRNPDVSWNKKANPEPWNAYREKEYKLFSPGDKGPPKSQAPVLD